MSGYIRTGRAADADAGGDRGDHRSGLLPDIARIISAEGVVCLHGGTEQDGVTGTVRVTVLYTPENESGVRALEFAMPFSAQGEGLAGAPM